MDSNTILNESALSKIASLSAITMSFQHIDVWTARILLPSMCPLHVYIHESRLLIIDYWEYVPICDCPLSGDFATFGVNLNLKNGLGSSLWFTMPPISSLHAWSSLVLLFYFWCYILVVWNTYHVEKSEFLEGYKCLQTLEILKITSNKFTLQITKP